MKNLTLIFLTTFTITISAQEVDNKEQKMAQVTFAYPVGSNGAQAMEYSNNFSFNILYGLNGGVNGAEIGSIFNYNKGSVSGFQLAGVGNFNTGATQGLLISGVANITQTTFSGIALSGAVNYANDSSKGAQISVLNLSTQKFTGLQLGAINYAKKVKGMQLGVINYQGTNSGYPIGIVSIAKGGLYKFELTGGEVFYTNLSYKMGVERLYTIYKVGNSSYKSKSVYSVGLGFGSQLPIGEKHRLIIDVSGNQIVYDNNWDSGLNLLNKLDLNYEFKLTPALSILAGPSLNVYVSDVKVEGEYGTLNIPYTLSTSEWSNGKTFTWVGFNAGIGVEL